MTHFRGVLRAALCCLAAGLGHSAAAQQAELPLWELGVGVLGRAASDYPGADDYSASLTPVPFIRYRGNFLELGGDDALRVVPFRTERFELGFSFDSSARVVNRVTAIGAVLEDLDRSLEVGPELIYRFWDTPTLFGQTFPGHLEAILQTRWVYSLDDSVDWEGTLYRPALRYRQYGTLGPGSRIQLSLGPIWTTEGLQDFYYQVPGADGYDARARLSWHRVARRAALSAQPAIASDRRGRSHLSGRIGEPRQPIDEKRLGRHGLYRPALRHLPEPDPNPPRPLTRASRGEVCVRILAQILQTLCGKSHAMSRIGGIRSRHVLG